MSAWDAFAWGGVVGCLVMHLLNRAYERLLQQRLELMEKKATLLQHRLDQQRVDGNELLASRVELAFNFYAMRRAARDEVQS